MTFEGLVRVSRRRGLDWMGNRGWRDAGSPLSRQAGRRGVRTVEHEVRGRDGNRNAQRQQQHSHHRIPKLVRDLARERNRQPESQKIEAQSNTTRENSPRLKAVIPETATQA